MQATVLVVTLTPQNEDAHGPLMAGFSIVQEICQLL
jgi:hypothetical protein